VAYAQDSQGRHVAVKFVNGESEEYRIMRFLQECGTTVHEQGLIPILDFLPYYSNWFVVMPRWGSLSDLPWFSTVGEVLSFIHCLLKAVNFLHQNLIVHRDINIGNILANHFAQYDTYDTNILRPQLRSNGSLTYVLCDFDCSMMFSPSKPRDLRLHSDLSFEIRIIIPDDTSQGELDYDPFVFEMGCLGISLVQKFQQCTPIVPFLAPLMDRLITRTLTERFTASEAVQFFESMQMNVTSEQLATQAPPRLYLGWQSENYDRWAGLPADFVKEWSSYRAPPPSLGTRLLQKIFVFYWPWGCRFLRMLRRVARFFTHIL
ncbi:kinase-like domain-containing protein, partial [Hysterangium stoloniferum]